ncbi:hypothetical protein CHS0354_029568 [Potamilus streckersoni]|uniref:RING-type domain-containing protein n=1 Tax=Potamilus streckersoni TaxID=2493646 RepID=A0AAE0SAP3_9BIVA|nr:hypothetical protein CHS0354_029568 [Potamilus streckersoni]
MAETQEATYKPLNCPICLETFESPKVLVCLHTFCEKCICRHAHSLKEAGAQSDTIACPICRSPTPAPSADQTPDEWAAKLTTNSIILSLLASGQPNMDDSVYCQPCLTLGKQNMSVAYCGTCSEYLCNICYSCHKSFKISKDHSITVQSVSAQQNRISTQDMYRCSVHWKKYKYLCSNHKELCCSNCVIKDHRKCDELLLVKELSKGSKEGQDSSQISEKLESANKIFMTLVESLSKNLESIDQQKIAITKSIQDWTITMRKHIDRLETPALEELNQMCKQENIKVSDQIMECKRAIAAIATSKEMLMGGRKSEDDTKIFITTNKVSRQVLKYLEKYKTIENNSEIVELEFHFDSTFEGMSATLSSIGKLTRQVVRIPRLSSDMLFENTKMPKIQPNSKMVTFNAQIRSEEDICDIHSGVFLLDDRLVLCDWANFNLKLFDRRLQCVSYLNMEDQPKYICRVDESTVAVTVDRDIQLVSVTNTLTPLRRINERHTCYGIASYQQNIIVDTEGDSLITYGTLDKIINRIISYDKLDVHNTHCVSQDGQRIYYTRKNAVVTMNMEGTKLIKFESTYLRDASGITVDKQGIIYCCGKESNTVITVTPEGRQLCVLLSQDHKLQNPQGIFFHSK